MNDDQIRKLHRYISLIDDDERMAAILCMTALYPHARDRYENLFIALEKELESELKWFEENTRMVETEVAQTYTRFELEFLNDK